MTSSTLTTIHEPSFKVPSPTQSDHHTSIAKPKRKQKIIMRKVPCPLRSVKLEEAVPNIESPTFVASSLLRVMKVLEPLWEKEKIDRDKCSIYIWVSPYPLQLFK